LELSCKMGKVLRSIHLVDFSQPMPVKKNYF
jgi:hypothetical protein